MREPVITPELIAKHNLTPDEYERVKAILGREPTYTELGIFSVMWSEHCSYKSTRPLLKTFPTKSPRILVGAGEENAGIIDIGDGLAIAFKIESHNHPSAVEPFQGAAFASQDITEESAEHQRGAVQVGDPFMEKLVMEACLELLATDSVAGIQDMGAAGLTCSTCETAARASTGIEIELSKVPQRAPHMTPYEIMLSESQERMLIIVKAGREDEVKRIFDKWDLPWAQVGEVTDTGRMVVTCDGTIVADIPAAKLADEAPVYY